MDPWSAIPERIVLKPFLYKGHDFEGLVPEILGISYRTIGSGELLESYASTISNTRTYSGVRIS